MLVIRPAVPEDVPDIGQLIRELAAYEREPALRFYQSLGARPLDAWLGMRMEGEALRRLAEHE